MKLTKQGLARFTIDLSVEEHTRIKVLAAKKGETMREIVLKAIRRVLTEYDIWEGI